MKIKSNKTIKLEKSIPVYDITVDDTHNFVCEGVVVHNSDGIPGFYKLGEKAAEVYSTEILMKNLTDFSELKPAPRVPKEGLVSLVSNQERFHINCKLMDLKLEDNHPLKIKIIKEICLSNIINPDLYVANQKLTELGMNRALSFSQNIYEANESCPPKEYIKYFL